MPSNNTSKQQTKYGFGFGLVKNSCNSVVSTLKIFRSRLDSSNLNLKFISNKKLKMS
jgi:hypothetical protein